MKNLFSILAVVLIGIAAITSSCKKDRTDEPIIPSVAVTKTTVSGIVFSTGHYPMADVEVKIGNTVVTTKYDGSFLFTNIPISSERVLVKFSKQGYFETFQTRIANANGVTRIEATLVGLNSGETATYNTSFTTGNETVLTNGWDTLVYFPASLNFVDEFDAPYTGNVNVYAKYLDATSSDYSKVAPGGDQFGSFDGTEKFYLNSFGGLMVQLLDDNGNKLNLASTNTEKAQVHIAIPVALQTSAPGSIDLWYGGGDLVYASNGGSGRRDGPKYVSGVSHFSMWSMQQKSTDFATVKGTVTDCIGEPVAGIRVQIGQTYDITDNNGEYSRKVPSGIIVPVQILAEDYFGNSATQYTSQLSAGETATIDLSVDCVGKIYGKIVNCTGSPISGQVIVHDGSNISKTYTSNGIFKLPFSTSSNYLNVTYKINGYEETKYYYPSGGSYDVGNVMICVPTPPPVGSNTITINDTATYSNFTEATGRMYGTSLSMSIQRESDYMNFSIDPCSGIGFYTVLSSNSPVSAYFDLSPNFYNLAGGSTVEITAFGGVGGRIIGTFTGTDDTGNNIKGKFDVFHSPDEN